MGPGRGWAGESGSLSRHRVCIEMNRRMDGRLVLVLALVLVAASFVGALGLATGCGSDPDPAKGAEEAPADGGGRGASDSGRAPDSRVADEVEPADRDELITRYAPHLHLNPEDPNLPANVDWYLGRVSMRFHHDNCKDHEVLPLGSVTQAALVEQRHPLNGSLCRHDDAKVVDSRTSELFFLEIASPDETYLGAPRSEWKTYAVWRPSETAGRIDIEYWFFYPFNDNVAMFDHESDWEHVRVTVDPKAESGRGAATAVKLSQHHEGQTFEMGDAALSMDGTHPVAYVAKGTHANYPSPGTFKIEGTGGAALDVARAAAPADVWKTETAVVDIGTRAKPKNGQLFVQYWGRWGEIRDLPETNGIVRHFP